MCRPNRCGQWLYNENADPVPAHPEELDREAVIIRESMPIDLPAMFLICAKHHSVMAWDAFLDTFGIPNILISMPPNTTEEQALAFDLMAQKLIGEGRGTLPNGADVKTVETAQNNTENFHSRAKWCNEAIITLATGGTLTVTSAPDSGTLAGNAHTDSFERLCAGTARDISETINAQFCRRILKNAFPEEPILARFTLAPEPADERLQQAQILATLRQAGWKPTAETVEEMMHFPVEAEQLPTMGNDGSGMGNAFAPVANSSPAETKEGPASVSPLTPEEISLFQNLAGGMNEDVLLADAHAAEQALTAAVQGNGTPTAQPVHAPAKNTENTELSPVKPLQNSDFPTLISENQEEREEKQANCNQYGHSKGCKGKGNSESKGISRETKTTAINKSLVERHYAVNPNDTPYDQKKDLATAITRAATDGERLNAVLSRPEIGSLILDCGHPGRKDNPEFSMGQGVQHALEPRHNVDALLIADTLLKGKIEKQEKSKSRYQITKDGIKVIVDTRLKKKGKISQKVSRIVTAFKYE